MPKSRSKTSYSSTKSKAPIFYSLKNQKDYTKANHKLSKDLIDELENMFLMGGITSYQAARFLGIKYDTVKKYFEYWAEQITEEPQHMTWISKEKKARARALESITKQILPVISTLTHFEKLLHKLMIIKNKQGIEELSPNVMNKIESVLYIERTVRLNRIYLSELQQQYTSIELRPPAEAILDRELEIYIAEKQQIPTIPITA